MKQRKIEDLSVIELKAEIFDSQQRVQKEQQIQQVLVNRIEQLMKESMQGVATAPQVKSEVKPEVKKEVKKAK